MPCPAPRPSWTGEFGPPGPTRRPALDPSWSSFAEGGKRASSQLYFDDTNPEECSWIDTAPGLRADRPSAVSTVSPISHAVTGRLPQSQAVMRSSDDLSPAYEIGITDLLDHVIYPPQYDPRISPIYALNEIDVKAPPEAVWKLLVSAENLSSYFPPENQVEISSGEPELRLGTRYRRVTIGFPMSLIVTECVPDRRLSWSTSVDGDETGSSAFHGWVISPTKGGCHVLSGEAQQGPWFLDQLGHKHPGGLYSYHQDWVEALARAAETRSV